MNRPGFGRTRTGSTRSAARVIEAIPERRSYRPVSLGLAGSTVAIMTALS